jgi:Domain of unknown function (DUF4170)
MSELVANQLLHLVFGGKLTSPGKVEFKGLNNLDMVASTPTTRRSTKRGVPRHTPPLIMRRCGILSSTSTV